MWDVLSDLEAWPQRIETVDVVELLTPAPVGEGSRVRLKQPKLPEGIWEVTVWDAPSYFEYRQQSGGITSVAGHRVEALEEGRSRLTLTLDMRGLLVPVFGRVLQGPDQPLHDHRGAGHEARRRVRLRSASLAIYRRKRPRPKYPSSARMTSTITIIQIRSITVSLHDW